MNAENIFFLQDSAASPSIGNCENLSALLGLMGDLDLRIVSYSKADGDSPLRGAVA